MPESNTPPPTPSETRPATRARGSKEEHARLRHRQSRRSTQPPPWLAPTLWVAGLLGLGVLLWLLGPVLTPFLVGALIAYLLDPTVGWLHEHGMPRWAATLLVVMLAGLIIVLLVLMMIPVIQNEISLIQERLPNMMASVTRKIAPLLRDLGWRGRLDADAIRKWGTEQLAAYGSDIVPRILTSIRASGGARAGFMANMLLIPIVSFYLLQDWQRFMKGLEVALPRRWHADTMEIVREIDELLSQFFRGQLMVMLVLAGYYTGALSLAGFDLAAPIGILTGLLIFIPYVGFTMGLVLALIAALVQFGDAWGFAMVAMIYGAGQVVESFFLTPRLVGERIGLHPVAVLFALLAFGQLFGFFGFLAALPLSAALLVGIKRGLRVYLRSNLYRYRGG